MNLAFDAALGVVPVIGDLADVAFKANQRNVQLLVDRDAQGRAERSSHGTWRDWAAVGAAALAFVAVFGAAIYAVVALVRAIG